MSNDECPVCGAPNGFHDAGPHEAREIPSERILPKGWLKR